MSMFQLPAFKLTWKKYELTYLIYFKGTLRTFWTMQNLSCNTSGHGTFILITDLKYHIGMQISKFVWN